MSSGAYRYLYAFTGSVKYLIDLVIHLKKQLAKGKGGSAGQRGIKKDQTFNLVSDGL